MTKIANTSPHPSLPNVKENLQWLGNQWKTWRAISRASVWVVHSRFVRLYSLNRAQYLLYFVAKASKVCSISGSIVFIASGVINHTNFLKIPSKRSHIYKHHFTSNIKLQTFLLACNSLFLFWGLPLAKVEQFSCRLEWRMLLMESKILFSAVARKQK